MDILIPLVVFVPLSGLVLAACVRVVPADERGWLLNVLLWCLGLRILTATIFVLAPALRIFHEDAGNYEIAGLQLASAWRGEIPPWGIHKAQNVGFFYISGAIYYILGSYRVNVSYVNALMSTLTVFFIYRLSSMFFHKVVARRAALFNAFFPSMILWGSIALKEPLVTLLIVICLTSCIRLKSEFSVSAFLGTVLPVAALQPIRFYMVYFVCFAILAAFMLDRGVRFVTGVYKQILIGGIIVALFAVSGMSDRAQEGAEYFSLERVSGFRGGMATSAQSGFSADADVSTPLRAALFLPIGMAVLLLGPFPWQFTSVRSLTAAPETIIWWFMFPAAIAGMRLAMRTRWSETSALLLFTAALTCAYSLMHGNVGTAFRLRGQIFVFLFIFAALGAFKKKCDRAGLDERHLLK
jgi:hypothetical protein